MGRGGAVRNPRLAGRTLPGQRPTEGAPLNQGRLISGLDAHKAKRLAQGFDKPSVEVMLHACKGSTNASYQGYWARFCLHCEERETDPYEATIMEIVGSTSYSSDSLTGLALTVTSHCGEWK